MGPKSTAANIASRVTTWSTRRMRAEEAAVLESAADDEDSSCFRKSCVACRKLLDGRKSMQCERCRLIAIRSVSYCAPACQKAHWPTHKLICGKTFSGLCSAKGCSASVPPCSTVGNPPKDGSYAPGDDELANFIRKESFEGVSLHGLLDALARKQPRWAVSKKRLSKCRQRLCAVSAGPMVQVLGSP